MTHAAFLLELRALIPLASQVRYDEFREHSVDQLRRILNFVEREHVIPQHMAEAYLRIKTTTERWLAHDRRN